MPSRARRERRCGRQATTEWRSGSTRTTTSYRRCVDKIRPEYAAILELKDRSDRGEVTLFVSEVHEREAVPLREDRKQAQKELLAFLPKVVFVEDQRLVSMDSILSNRGGPRVVWLRHEEEPIARRLQKIGLKRLDAHHVMVAIKNECAVFVTCDFKTILKYRQAVEAEFPILLMRPSEFTQHYPRVPVT